MQLGLENKKKTIWAVVLGVIAILAVAYEFIPMLMGPSTPDSSAQAAAPVAPRVTARAGAKAGKKPHMQDLDPTLKLDLLASSEKTIYEGSGRNIFVSQADPAIPKALGTGTTDQQKKEEEAEYKLPAAPQATPIPLKYYGFASKAGEPKKIFLKLGEDVWIAGEGDMIDRRYKVVRITPTSVEIQDVVNSGPPQNVPLTTG